MACLGKRRKVAGGLMRHGEEVGWFVCAAVWGTQEVCEGEGREGKGLSKFCGIS